ncbi:uncharacterized protein LOC124321850 [Daphnia pulicaria]|uniref:uncharacterized protein LOC124321850 n=1 Tax=Daphnia pulicaria TaxID=35523 RepID=UPI001EEA57DC|nr:uncharacterized protein LOC124321850 [Daphnia pulicaria]
MPESLKLLGLQESLKEDIQRRVAHIFTGAYTFQSAWAELEKKYGSQHLIIQAHDQHMQQLPSFRNGDFNALFNLAAAVRDAVSSVDESHVMMFNTVANLLHTKLPINLQTDWGKYAYGLDRMATLKDFDKWIDRVLSAEELRGGKLSSSNPTNAVKNPIQPSNSNRQLGSYTPGSSNYNSRGPTVLASNITTLSDCPACKESPAHRLEMCNVFKRMLVNARASLCATNNHCFKCLVRGHYGRKCDSTESKCKECQGPHHSLLHGAERQFPASSRNQGSRVSFE